MSDLFGNHIFGFPRGCLKLMKDESYKHRGILTATMLKASIKLPQMQPIFEPPHEKTNILRMRKQKMQIGFTVAAKLISAFVFTTWIVQFLYFLNSEFPDSNHLLSLYSSVCVGPEGNLNHWFSHDVAHFCVH